MKKIVALFLAMSLLLSATSFVLADEEPVEVSIMIRHIGSDTDDQNIISDELEKRLNMKINWIQAPSSNYGTQCTTVIAGGDYPDAMEFTSGQKRADIEAMAEDGVIIPLDDLLAKYGQDILANRDDYQWNTYEGKIYSIQCRRQEFSNNVWQIRKDWLDKLNLEVPTTLDEFHDVLIAFRDNSDLLVGEGNVLIPFGFMQGEKALGLEQLVYGAYGFIANWIDVDGHATYYVNHPNFKEALRTIRTWFQEGLLDPEYAISNREQNLQKLYQGQFGSFMNYLDGTNTTIEGGYLYNFLQTNPEAELAFIMPFADDTGKGNITRSTSWNEIVIFSDTTEEQQIALMKLFNYMISEEGSDLVEMGIEGVNWKDNGDGTADFSWIDSATTEMQQELGYYSYNWCMKRNYFPRWNSAELLSVGAAYGEHLADPCIIASTPAGVEYSTTLNDVLSRRNKLIMDPDIDFDAEFDKMVSDWNNWGGAEWTEEMDELYQKQKAQ